MHRVVLQSNQRTKGFTIVELLIVVVVIAILAAITIVAYTGVQERARTSTLQSGLSSAARAMEVAYVDSGSTAYGTTFPSNVRPVSGSILSLSQNGTSFCVNAEPTATSTNRPWHYNPLNGGIREGLCPGAVISNSELGASPNLVDDQNFQTITTTGDNWWTVVGSGSAFTMSTRPGTASDPIPNRPVLVVTSSATQPSASFAYIRGPVNETAITSGTSYMTSYYVRLASGTFTTELSNIAVMSGSATNASISYSSAGGVPTSTWRKNSRTTSAVQNGVSGTFMYISMPFTQVRTTTFSLEFQNFEIRAN
jgi:prepilin-type N-terminal cleavage/methylation domain-containing protein